MIILPDGGRASPREILAALVAEAHRRGVSYGALVAALDEFDKEKILREWWTARREAALRESPREERGSCGGCRYWRPVSESSHTTELVCHYLYDTGRARRRGERGECLEFEEVTLDE